MIYLRVLVVVITLPLYIGACSVAEGNETPERTRTALVKASDSLGGFCGFQTNGACSNDTDCTTGGASGHVCQSTSEEMILTTAEWTECYDAKAYGVSCACVKNACQWTKSNNNKNK